MKDGRDEQIAKLMKEGLDHYALGEAPRAVACWRRVLALDSEHAEAQDYLRSAESDEDPGGTAGTEAPVTGDLLSDARAMMRRGDLREAVDLLESLVGEDPAALEAQAFLDLARARLVGRYRERVGRGEQALRMRVSSAEVLKFNLPPAAGFLLSRIDGGTSIDELLALSGMDPFETLRALAGMLDAGLVETSA
jgi:tetratricopeptide (TPR) repeat protein